MIELLGVIFVAIVGLTIAPRTIGMIALWSYVGFWWFLIMLPALLVAGVLDYVDGTILYKLRKQANPIASDMWGYLEPRLKEMWRNGRTAVSRTYDEPQ